MKFVIDIETAGCELSDLSLSQQEYMLREANKEEDEAKREKKAEEANRMLSLYALTAKVVVIGMLDVESQKRYMLYEQDFYKETEDKEKLIKCKGMPERDLLVKFWEIMEKADQIITFNGRGFDIPFLMLRSAKLKVKPSKNFIGNRYDSRNHIDLLEQFSFYGITKRFNLDFYCHSFGVASPKSEEMSGYNVKEKYLEGKIEEVTAYCAEDIKATYELYKIYKEYLNI